MYVVCPDKDTALFQVTRPNSLHAGEQLYHHHSSEGAGLKEERGWTGWRKRLDDETHQDAYETRTRCIQDKHSSECFSYVAILTSIPSLADTMLLDSQEEEEVDIHFLLT